MSDNREIDEDSSTPAILDMLSNDCEWAADTLMERWAGLRSELQTAERKVRGLEAEREGKVLVPVQDHYPLIIAISLALKNGRKLQETNFEWATRIYRILIAAQQAQEVPS